MPHGAHGRTLTARRRGVDTTTSRLAPRLLAVFALALLGVVALGACNGRPTFPEDEWGTILVAPGAAVPVGVSTGLTGDLAAVGADIRDAVQMALRDHPEVAGHQVRALIEDDRCEDGGSVRVAEKFRDRTPAVAVVGPMCAGGAVRASEVYEAARIAMITPSATAPLVTARNMETVFRTAWNDRVQGWGQALFALGELGATTAVVVHDDTVYGQSLADVFGTAFEESGGQVLSVEKVERGQEDFAATLTTIQDHAPAVVVFEGFAPEGTLFVRQLREAGVTVPVIAGDGLRSRSDFILASEGAAEGVYISGGATREGPLFDDFVVRFTEAYGREPGLFAAQAYDAAAVIIDAVGRASVQLEDGSLAIGRKAFNDALRATKRAGVSGEIEFAGSGDRLFAADVIIERVEGEEFVPLRRVELQPGAG